MNARQTIHNMVDFSGGRFGFFMSFVLPAIALVCSLSGTILSSGILLGWW